MTEGNNLSRYAEGTFWGMEARHMGYSSTVLIPPCAIPFLSPL